MRYLSQSALFALVLSLVVVSCKNNDDPPNPFDDPSLQPPADTVEVINFESTSFEGLHYNIFRTTCANSGCHDGTFEPDFRSIESSYNTLVYQPVIKNDAGGTFTYRVAPGDPDNSVLYHRLLVDIDGQSGIMPLVIGPESDWTQKEQEYIQDIRTWIENGAPDVNGNLPTTGNQLPQMLGVVGYAGGSSTPLDREPGQGPIKVPQGTTDLELWFSIEDAETALLDLSYNKVKVSLDLNDFGGIPEYSLNVVTNGVTAPGYLGDNVNFTHSFTFDASSYAAGTTLFLRVYVQDDGPTLTEIPTQGSFNYIKEYAAIIIE